MRDSQAGSATRRFVIIFASLCAFVALPLLSNARARAGSVNVVNNSTREIIHVYLSSADQDDWGPNQLGDAIISSGQSFTISNVSCNAPQIKVVAEDRDGCFLSAVVNCGEAATWSITNETAADCGL
jgi:hypothetical protein